MNILIAYFSQTGNTAKVARAIYEEVLCKGDSRDDYQTTRKQKIR